MGLGLAFWRCLRASCLARLFDFDKYKSGCPVRQSDDDLVNALSPTARIPVVMPIVLINGIYVNYIGWLPVVGQPVQF